MQINRSDILVLKFRRLLLLDGLGATLSASLLIGILSNYEEVFGMPKLIIWMLAIPPIAYAGFSLGAYFFVKSYHQRYLKMIAGANISYCLLSLVCLYLYFERLTIWGVGYFLGEILIILSLVYLELKAVQSAQIS